MPEWMTRYARPREGWLAFALLLVMLLSVSWSVQRVGWLPQLDLLVPVAFYAALLGAFLGLTSLTVVAVLPLSALIGTGVVLWATAGEYYPALDQLHRQLAMRTEVIEWVRIIVDRGYGPQLVPYAIGLGGLMWATAFTASYTIYRHHRALDAILLVGAALLVNMSAAVTDLFYLILFVLAALLLWLRVALIGQEEGWQRRRVNENSEVPAAVMRSGVLFIVGSIFMAWVLTSVAVAAPLTAVWNNLDGVWSNVRDGVDDFFAPLANDKARITGAGFGNGFSIQGRWVSSDEPVLTMAAEEPYYLRTATYENYTGHGFARGATNTRRVDAGQPLFTADSPEIPLYLDAFETKTVAIQYQKGQSHLFAPEGYPVQFFAPAQVLETGGLPILGGIESPSFISEGKGYQVTVLVSKATKSELRAAGDLYPAIITQNYLGIGGVSEQTKQLAEQIVQRAGADNPFDMADALANYLRTDDSFRYSTTAAIPTGGQDFVDFFLFDTEHGRVGYCEYYATTMAVLARTLGLPSRVAVGYSAGSLIGTPTGTEDRTYQYREENSHAWTEIYFPGYGWQRFEATPGRSAVIRTNGAPVSPGPTSSGGPRPGQTLSPGDVGDVSNLPSMEEVSGGFGVGEVPPPPDTRGPNLLLITTILMLVAAVAVWRLQRSRRRLRFLAPGERQWFRLALAADRAGIAQRPSETIYEYAGWLEEQMPAQRPAIRTIADGKVWQSYSGRGISGEAIARIEAAWKRLQLPILWLGIKRRVASILPRRSNRA